MSRFVFTCRVSLILGVKLIANLLCSLSRALPTRSDLSPKPGGWPGTGGGQFSPPTLLVAERDINIVTKLKRVRYYLRQESNLR